MSTATKSQVIATGASPNEKVVKMTITPDMAKKFLANQGAQRNARKYKIRQYATDMREGKWLFNAAPIVFDTTGRMRDGQNRMFALIEAEVTLDFIVLQNASEATISTIDTGMNRTFADVTRMQGIPNATAIAAAASHWWKYENKAMNRQDRPSHKQLETIRDTHLNALDEALKMARHFRTAKSLAGNSPLIFVLGYLHERNPQLANEFGMALDTGVSLLEGDPMLALRRTLTNNATRRGKMSPVIITALMIKTFNFRYAGRSVQNVMYRKGELFPEFAI